MQIRSVTTATIPGYRVYEYLLVLDPHKELCDRITGLRTRFAEEYKTAMSRGKPQVMLANFLQYEMKQERLLNRLRVVGMGATPYKMELRDFGSFPSHTIYIPVVSKVPFQRLVKDIRREANSVMTLNKENKPYFPEEPYVTIARKLLPWQYEKGWLEYSHKKFTGRFIADNMVLLRRPVGEMKYQVVQRFEFQNMPVMTRQGELFA